MKRAALLVAALGACSPAAPAREATPASTVAPPPAVVAAPGECAPWRYEVAVAAGALSLAVTVTIPEGAWGALEVEPLADPFLRDVTCSTGGPFAPLAPDAARPGEPAWTLPRCPPGGCRLRYRFALDEAARELDSESVAARDGGAFLSPPSAWLLHPVDPPETQPFRLRVTAPAGVHFAVGLLPAPEDPAVYAADVSDLAKPPLAAFGELRVRTVDVGGELLDVALLPGPLDLSDDAVAAFVAGAARVVRDYQGRAPIARALILVQPTEGRGVGYGRTHGNGGASVLLPVGRASTSGELTEGWELVHELLHVAFPNLAREHLWLAEGEATYVEPILRARRGLLREADLWAHFRRRMAFGQPAPGDEGLDRTRTWGRLYWGGALFCLLADVAIRTRTENRRSLDDALRAVLAEGGNVADRWSIERVLAVGDAATGVPVLAELYAAHARAAVPVDLAALFRDLGVKDDGALDDGARLASVRRAIIGAR